VLFTKLLHHIISFCYLSQFHAAIFKAGNSDLFFYTLAEAGTMADDYAMTDKINYLKNKSAGCVSKLNYVQNMFPSYNHVDRPKPGSWEKNRKSYSPIEMDKGELPKSVPSCSYCKKMGHLVSESLYWPVMLKFGSGQH
jgi:hypothetical protein